MPSLIFLVHFVHMFYVHTLPIAPLSLPPFFLLT